MNIATRSVSMCPASASSAIELIHSAVTSSSTKNAARIAAPMIIRPTRVSPPPWLWSCPAPMQPNICAKSHMLQDSEPGRPEPGQSAADRHQRSVDPGQVDEPEHHREEHLVELRHQQHDEQDQEPPALHGLQGALGVRFEIDRKSTRLNSSH